MNSAQDATSASLSAGFHHDYLAESGGEGSARLFATAMNATSTAEKPGEASWHSYQGRSAVIDLQAAFSSPLQERAVVYAFSRIIPQTPGPHRLFLGVDDCARVWINQNLVYDNLARRGALRRREISFDANLTSGTNAITIKLGNDTSNWMFCLEAYDLSAIQQQEHNRQEFTAFDFDNHPQLGPWLQNYLKYHLRARGPAQPVLFNKEYLTISDMWLSGAMDNGSLRTLQEGYAVTLQQEIKLTDDGYVMSHQHMSHCNDLGWPFPLWPQVWNGWDGITRGWHFQAAPLNEYGVWGLRMLPPTYTAQTAADEWKLENLESLGFADNAWNLRITGPSPAIETVSPKSAIDAFNSPFLQIRWKPAASRSPLSSDPNLEWCRAGDQEFSPARRIYFSPDSNSSLSGYRGFQHALIETWKHPLWRDKIDRLRISLQPGAADIGTTISLDSIFTCYDTRHSVNNSIFIQSSWEYFRWSGDIRFLRGNIQRMRTALNFMSHALGGYEFNRIRVPWWGHDGLPGWRPNPDGSKTTFPGHGIGNNYWDLLPMGHDDMYATQQYCASLNIMARIEELVRIHPEWGVPRGPDPLEPALLRERAELVKADANRFLWNEAKGRFVACIDIKGQPHDYGLTFLNLESIWYGIASDKHAQSILDWISGKRIISSDTSTGDDIYHWRFAPRATTVRNIDWYCPAWVQPEILPFGDQVQDGGAVLGFSFFDLWARLKYNGPDDAWARFMAIYTWDAEVAAQGGYRAYYAKEKKRGSLQGGGTAGGLGIDCEFYESSMLAAIIPLGFMGLDPQGDCMAINPRLPSACPGMTIENLLYHGCRMTLTVKRDEILIQLQDQPVEPLSISPPKGWRLYAEQVQPSASPQKILLDSMGKYRIAP
jgi:hypothetical protein